MVEENPRYPQSNVYTEEVNKFAELKKRWYKIKNSPLFLKLRESKLNSYHKNLNYYDMPKKEAIDIARARGEKTILFRGENGRKTRCYVELDCPVEEELQKYGSVFRGGKDVTDRLPRDKNGKLDLFAEEPIIIAIVPMEGPSLVGHVCMQYKDKVVNRRGKFMDNAPIWETYGLNAQYYAVYPSKLGLSPEKIEQSIENTNVFRGKLKYDLGNNNCADNTAYTLKKSGVKDINFLGLDKLGITWATPGNNPFGFGIKSWCQKNGVHLRPQEMLQYKYNNFNTAEKNKALYDKKREDLLDSLKQRV